MTNESFPAVLDTDLVGFFDSEAHAGGGLVWDAVLEYRVWVHQDDNEDDLNLFVTYEDAKDFAEATPGAEAPLALVLQREYIDEDEEGVYEHVEEARITEWPVEFLRRPQRTERTIPDFLESKDPDRLDRLRGIKPTD